MKYMYKSYASKGRLPLWLVSLLLFVLLLCLSVVALKIGHHSMRWEQIWQAFIHYDAFSSEHVIVRQMRVPRVGAALLIGSALAMAGVLMQTISRNPLADPGILGVNAGAALAVVISIIILGTVNSATVIFPAIACSAVVAVLVFWLSTAGQADATPARLVLAGAAISALLFAFVRAILLVSQKSLDTYRHWVTGSLQGVSLDNLLPLLPFFALAFALAMTCTLLINALVLGDDVAKSLGTKVKSAKALCLLTITLLCASSVTLAGPISFLGLVVPHLAQSLVGNDGRAWMLTSALLGAALLLFADILGRVLFVNMEIQAGLMVALLGGVVFLWSIRRTQGVRL